MPCLAQTSCPDLFNYIWMIYIVQFLVVPDPPLMPTAPMISRRTLLLYAESNLTSTEK
uniref:Uncharacterized protein n=1 Tax=Megaselia scalaris TaxID=36166 RepID=T1GGJ7_MEGSC